MWKRLEKKYKKGEPAPAPPLSPGGQTKKGGGGLTFAQCFIIVVVAWFAYKMLMPGQKAIAAS